MLWSYVELRRLEIPQNVLQLKHERKTPSERLRPYYKILEALSMRMWSGFIYINVGFSSRALMNAGSVTESQFLYHVCNCWISILLHESDEKYKLIWIDIYVIIKLVPTNREILTEQGYCYDMVSR
jgi:hypothetical protein